MGYRMSKFTPGPWSWVERHVWSVPRNFDVCILTEPIKKADANLIAKAPEMYDLIEELRCVLITVYDAEDGIIDKSLIAIKELQEKING